MVFQRNDEQADAMYKLYQEGYSLADIGKVFGCSRQSVHDVFKWRNWPLRPRKKPLPFLMFNGAKYTLRNTGYYGRTDAKRTLMHRDVWEFHNGPIPKDYDIHHVDEDKMNNAIENLECLPKSEHTRKYSPHNNQHTRGRKKKDLPDAEKP